MRQVIGSSSKSSSSSQHIVIRFAWHLRKGGTNMKFWHDMRKKGMKMNTAAYNAMVDVQAKLGNIEAVSEIVGHMADDGCTPDVITHSTIVKGYAVKGDLDKALEILRGTQEAKVSHNSFVYNTILDGCAKHARPDLVDTILDSMKEHSILLTNYTLIHGHCAAYFCVLD